MRLIKAASAAQLKEFYWQRPTLPLSAPTVYPFIITLKDALQFFFSLFLVFAANNAASFFFLSPSLQETARGLSLLSFFFPLVFLSTSTKHVSFLCDSFFFQE